MAKSNSLKKAAFFIVFLLFLLYAKGFLFAYGEGPTNSENYVYGKITYSSGSTCGNCCGVAFSMYRGGQSETGCADADGNYKIYVASRYLSKIYFKGSVLMEFSNPADTKGGYRFDILMK